MLKIFFISNLNFEMSVYDIPCLVGRCLITHTQNPTPHTPSLSFTLSIFHPLTRSFPTTYHHNQLKPPHKPNLTHQNTTKHKQKIFLILNNFLFFKKCFLFFPFLSLTYPTLSQSYTLLPSYLSTSRPKHASQ